MQSIPIVVPPRARQSNIFVTQHWLGAVAALLQFETAHPFPYAARRGRGRCAHDLAVLSTIGPVVYCVWRVVYGVCGLYGSRVRQVQSS